MRPEGQTEAPYHLNYDLWVLAQTWNMGTTPISCYQALEDSPKEVASDIARAYLAILSLCFHGDKLF